MRALIYKDVCVLWKQMRIFLVIVLVLSAIPSTFNNAFAVIYAAMLPYTTMAYDERSRWNQLAAMMPFSPTEMVLSKYALGWLCTVAALGLSMLVQLLTSAVIPIVTFTPALLFLAFSSALCALAITLPLMFRFGVEKGRLALFLIIFFICGIAGTLSSIAENPLVSGSLQGPVLLILPVLAVGFTLVSVPLSLRFYQRQKR